MIFEGPFLPSALWIEIFFCLKREKIFFEQILLESNLILGCASPDRHVCYLWWAREETCPPSGAGPVPPKRERGLILQGLLTWGAGAKQPDVCADPLIVYMSEPDERFQNSIKIYNYLSISIKSSLLEDIAGKDAIKWNRPLIAHWNIFHILIYKQEQYFLRIIRKGSILNKNLLLCLVEE